MKDREIVEYLDESVCYHSWEIVNDWSGNRRCINCDKISLFGEPNPTPTLEWMLDRLLEKEYEVTMSPWGGGETVRVILFEINPKYTTVEIAKTPTLALRGAVEKLITSEESK